MQGVRALVTPSVLHTSGAMYSCVPTLLQGLSLVESIARPKSPSTSLPSCVNGKAVVVLGALQSLCFFTAEVWTSWRQVVSIFPS